MFKQGQSIGEMLELYGLGWTAGYVAAPRWTATRRPYQSFVFLIEEFT